jgi:hypothetical protein
MKTFLLVAIIYLSAVSCTETQVNYINNSAILNALGNVMIHIAQQSVILSVSHLNAILHVLSQRTQFVTLNVRNLNVKLNALIKAVR